MNIQTGNKGDTRITEQNETTWYVEGVDSNGVWVLAEPGTDYPTQDLAEDAAEAIAESNGGKFLGVNGVYNK
jgi:hypothetical protein